MERFKPPKGRIVSRLTNTHYQKFKLLFKLQIDNSVQNLDTRTMRRFIVDIVWIYKEGCRRQGDGFTVGPSMKGRRCDTIFF